MSRSPTVISLYIGAGGLDLGFEAAGFDTRVSVESDHDCVRTVEFNRPNWRVLETDVTGPLAQSRNLLRVAQLQSEEPDILIGGPPCQPFSKSSYWAFGDAKRLDDPRATTLSEYLRVLAEVRPRAFLLENVPGLSYSGKDEGFSLLLRSIERINRRYGTRYSCEARVLRSTEFGVPQERSRLFVVGARDGTDFAFPDGDFAAPGTVREIDDQLALADFLLNAKSAGLNPCFTAWDAIGDLEDDDSPELQLSGKWADLVPSIPEGQNYLFHTQRGGGTPLFGWRRRYWSFLLKLSKLLPSWTIAAEPGPAIGPFHWHNRRLSRQELMRLQTFPDGYRIEGNARSAQRQLGNAVPVALAERLALEIRKQFFSERINPRRPSALWPKRRGSPPPPTPTKKVPRRYITMASDLEDHPGTGKGRRAKQRDTITSQDAGVNWPMQHKRRRGPHRP